MIITMPRMIIITIMTTITTRRLTSALAALLTAGALTTAGSAGSPRFLNDDPVWHEPDTQDASGIKADEVNLFVDLTYNLIAGAGQPRGRAGNLNSIDEVPDSSWFTNRQNQYAGQRMGWGQFIRWADMKVDEGHHHLHVGAWPSPTTAMWLQFTASPPNVVDVDGDGKNEVVVIPNLEMNEPYETVAYAIMVLEGAHGDGSRSAMRKAGFETLPRGNAPILVDGYYPPGGVPAALTIDIQGDAAPEIVVSLNDGLMQGDGNHPNAKGVAVIVANIMPKVEELLAKVEAKHAAD